MAEGLKEEDGCYVKGATAIRDWRFEDVDQAVYVLLVGESGKKELGK